ncbi:methylated-DNA--protein-cysteine methyltransferase [Fulvitalea axinellae]|uniref:Methylated-DNA--protein-cysteine methyltransferase n=1 Tax=Fulvitalea axinellae TaxID=1182444 RepID=A0AAU9CIJ9_9BACT|nr:methylated-DNA--protein-cysteine methyltransferase [Fulvitalea axinellae]
MIYDIVDTAFGEFMLAGKDGRLSVLSFVDGPKFQPAPKEWIRGEGAFEEAVSQLEAYFAGDLKEFDLSLAPEGTDFQCKVWRELEKIPFGETRTYEEISRALGNPKAVRAVGAANGANPIGIIVPCHRVVGKDGSLTGYAGGLSLKRKLLELEGRPGMQYELFPL